MGILIEGVWARFDSFQTSDQASPGSRVWLILAHPYGYKRALKRALNTAQRLNASLNVVFVIDWSAVSEMLRSLRTEGWWITGTRQNLQAEMRAGYRTLAQELLAKVRDKASQLGFPVETAIAETPLHNYVRKLLTQESILVVHSCQSLPANLREFTGQIEWIEEA